MNQLPETLEANAFYYVNDEASNSVAAYVTTANDGAIVAKRIGQSNTEINSLIDAKLQIHNSLKIVANIAERDLVAESLERSILVLVADATDDETVGVGAALYAYDAEEDTFTKIAEYESMDVELTWDSIEGRPASSVEDIDDAVTRRHSHANKEILDLVDEDSLITEDERTKLGEITDTGSGNIITAEERTKLEGIEEGANLYVHPETHSLDMIEETEELVVMTAEERAKLADIEAGANKTIWTQNEW